MTLACDLILASDDAFFQLPELRRGLLPDAGGVQRLPRQIPPKVAAGLMLTGRRLSAVEAHAWGLVHEVLPAHRLLAAALELATSIATSAPLALRALKATLRQNEQLSIQEALYRARPGNSGLPIVEQMLNSEDFFEGPRAFAEKRAPNWKGK